MNAKQAAKIMFPLLGFVLLIICFLYQIRQDTPYCFSLDSSTIDHVEIFHNGTSYFIPAPYDTQIIDNFNRLTLHRSSCKLSGFEYRVSFWDENGQIVISEDVLSNTHLLGREVVAGTIDMELLQAACQAGSVIE